MSNTLMKKQTQFEKMISPFPSASIEIENDEYEVKEEDGHVDITIIRRGRLDREGSVGKCLYFLTK